MALAVAAMTAALALAPSTSQAGSTTAFMSGYTQAQATFSGGVSRTSTGALTYQQGFSDPTILAELEGLITRADPGSWINISIFRIANDGRIERALQEAEADGVNVWIVYGNTDGALNGHPHVRVCPKACLSSQPDGIMHAKLATFSSTHRSPGSPATKATWVSSANLDANTGPEAFNNSITWFGPDEMYDRVSKVMQDMWNGPVVASDYHRPNLGEGYGYFNIDAARVYGHVSPEATQDLWADRLTQVKSPSEGGISPCLVRVAQAYFGDGLLDKDGNGSEDYANPAAELARLKYGGCNVAVLGHRRPGTNETNTGDATTAKLCAAGIPVRSIEKLHHKFAITSGSYEGATSSPQVITGSHNMTKDALRWNDEMMVRVNGSQALFDAYNNHFYEMWLFSEDECA
jgi:hypothetical protein